MLPIPLPLVGDKVFYLLPEPHKNAGTVRGAEITRVTIESGAAKCNLLVTCDVGDRGDGAHHFTVPGVRYDPAGTPGSWRYRN